jgi:anti-anti-sigma factor
MRRLSAAGDEMALTTSFDDGAATVVAVGELDSAAAGRLDHELQVARGPSGWGAVVLDLAGVTYLDSSAIPVIVRASEHARRGGGRFAIHNGTVEVTRFFQITGLDETLTFV